MSVVAALSALVALATLAAAPGCSSTGEVVFGVTTEIPGGAVLTRVETTLSIDDVAQTAQRLEGANLDFPIEISTGELAEGARVSLRVDAFAGGNQVVTRTAATSVLADRKLLLELALEDECQPVTCDAGETCVAGSCADPFQDPTSLPDYYDKWAGGETGDRCEPGGDPVVLLGSGQTDYHPIASGDVLDVEAGPQGGYHVWLAARLKNLRQSGSVTEISGTFPDLGYQPPPLVVVFTFDPDEGDFCKIYGLRFRLDDSDHPIEALLGQTLELRMTISDQDEDTATADTVVVLSDTFL